MKILVTGAAGYIGSVLVRQLLEKKYSVIGVDNLRYNNHYAISGLSRDTNWEFHNLEWIYPIPDLLAQADIVIPLAAIVGAPACDKDERGAWAVNSFAIKHLTLAMSKNQRIIYPNTNSGYGTKGETICTEESELAPISIYGRTKCAGEDAILQHPDSVSLRLATVCGPSPRMRFDLMVNDFCAKLYHYEKFTVYEPNYMRNFVHVNDVARAFIWMIEHPDLHGVFNVGHPDGNMAKIDLLDLIANTYQLQSTNYVIGDGRDPDQRNYNVSNKKILSTGFKFVFPIERAISQLEPVCGKYTLDELAKMGNV